MCEYIAENSPESAQRLVHQATDRPQRIILADPRFKIDIAEQ